MSCCAWLVAPLLLAVVLGLGTAGCDKKSDSAQGAATAGDGKAAAHAAGQSNQPRPLLKLSQYDKCGFCDLAAGPDGTLHAVFTDQPAYNKPQYLYYRSSADGGTTWSEARNLSDDESGNAAGHARVVIDGRGRVYATWKYVAANELLDGPGGAARGAIVYRCLDGGSWSKTVRLGDDKVPSYSWFAVVDPKGTLHVVWSQIAPDAAAAGANYYTTANLVRQTQLDGPAPAPAKGLIVPKPLLTKAEQDAMKAAGKYPKYEDTVAKEDGIINLRGYVDAAGVAHFVAEKAKPKSIVVWDGRQLSTVYEYEKYQTYNIFNNPPALLLDAAGKPHVIRSPEKSEKAMVRDYSIEDGKLADPVEAIAAKGGKGTILNWQATQLAGGRMAVTAALSEKGGYRAEDAEVYLTFSDGGGKWSAPVCVTDNAARQSFAHKETGGGNAVSTSSTYRPRFTSVAIGKDGRPCVLMVNSEDTILGLTSPGVTSSGRVVSVTGTGSVSDPKVFFVKL